MLGLLKKKKKKHCAVTCLISGRETRIHEKKQSATKPKGSTGNMGGRKSQSVPKKFISSTNELLEHAPLTRDGKLTH